MEGLLDSFGSNASVGIVLVLLCFVVIGFEDGTVDEEGVEETVEAMLLGVWSAGVLSFLNGEALLRIMKLG